MEVATKKKAACLVQKKHAQELGLVVKTSTILQIVKSKWRTDMKLRLSARRRVEKSRNAIDRVIAVVNRRPIQRRKNEDRSNQKMPNRGVNRQT